MGEQLLLITCEANLFFLFEFATFTLMKIDMDI